MSKHQNLAITLLSVMSVAWLMLLCVQVGWGKQKWMPRASVVAAVMAYTSYVAAALYAGAEFPGFLREHLFDGLVPAAAVGLLVNNFPAESPETALPWIRRPVMVLVAYLAGGALIFGLIAAAAVFSSGTGNFSGPVVLCASFGGLLFSGAFLGGAVPADVYRKSVYKKSRWSMVRWWFGKRPKPATTSKSGGPKDAPAPAATDAAESGADPRVPGDNLRASPDASQKDR